MRRDRETQNATERRHPRVQHTGESDHLSIVCPHARIEPQRNGTAGGEHYRETGDESPGAAVDSPSNQDDSEWKHQVGLHREGNEDAARQKRVGAMENEEQNQAKQEEVPKLTGHQAGDARAERKAQQVQKRVWTPMQSPQQPERKCERGELRHQPHHQAGLGAEQAKGKREEEAYGRTETDARSGSLETEVALYAQNGLDIVGVGMVDKLTAGGPELDLVTIDRILRG
jgi:hypothetical protein